MLTNGDMDRLHDGEFLNDNVIDFYLRHVFRKNDWHLAAPPAPTSAPPKSAQVDVDGAANATTDMHAAPEVERKSAYVFNTLFFKRLIQKGGYENVRRWTRKVDIFAYDFLFVPVNMSFHWSLAIICNPGRLADGRTPLSHQIISISDDEEVDEDEDKEDKKGEFGILLLDSLMCHSFANVRNPLMKYLRAELFSKKEMKVPKMFGKNAAIKGKKIK